MKYIIADPDEQSSIDLKKMLDGYETLDFQGSFTTLEATENSIYEEPPDLAFMRIGKTDLNAFKLAGRIRYSPTSITRALMIIQSVLTG